MNFPLEIDKKLESIAKEYLFVSTLDTQRKDALDFHEVAVWSIKDALRMAYLAGSNDATRGTLSMVRERLVTK